MSLYDVTTEVPNVKTIVREEFSRRSQHEIIVDP